jgi:queuine/archaeosine tRNA-ribosyltransferase
MLAPVVGGAVLRERVKSAEQMAQLGQAAGFTLTGFGMGEPPEQRAALLAACIKPLPPAKLRCVPPPLSDFAGTDFPLPI